MSAVLTLMLIIVLLSLIQSVFGVGLLLFGTPTLLFLGYSYSETLWIVLPASLSISLAQLYSHHHLVEAKGNAYLYTLLPAMISLVILLNYEEAWDVTKIVGSFLIMIGLLRTFKTSMAHLSLFINKKPRYFYLLTGIVHGLSNMGGGPLTILMAAIHKNKNSVRVNIAFVYCLFCIMQLSVLAFARPDAFNLNYLLFPLLSLLVYRVFNAPLMKKVNESKFQNAITFIILIYGLISFCNFN